MSESGDWQARADELHEEGDVPARRAQVVVLIADGLTHAEAAETLGIPRANIAKHVRWYRAERDDAEWLAANGPDI